MTTTPTHATHYAMRRGSRTLHLVVGVSGWYSGMTSTTECGVKMADVLEDHATRARPDAATCKRCMHTLGWDLKP
jgi:hypothetical protein